MNHVHPFGWIELTASTTWQRIVTLLVSAHCQTSQRQDIEHETRFYGVPESVFNGGTQGKREKEILVHDGSEWIERGKEGIRKAFDQGQWK